LSSTHTVFNPFEVVVLDIDLGTEKDIREADISREVNRYSLISLEIRSNNDSQ
jgi:hypothetical protein